MEELVFSDFCFLELRMVKLEPYSITQRTLLQNYNGTTIPLNGALSYLRVYSYILSSRAAVLFYSTFKI